MEKEKALLNLFWINEFLEEEKIKPQLKVLYFFDKHLYMTDGYLLLRAKYEESIPLKNDTFYQRKHKEFDDDEYYDYENSSELEEVEYVNDYPDVVKLFDKHYNPEQKYQCKINEIEVERITNNRLFYQAAILISDDVFTLNDKYLYYISRNNIYENCVGFSINAIDKKEETFIGGGIYILSGDGERGEYCIVARKK